MSLLQTRRLVLSLALALLWPVMVFAQTPVTPAEATPPQVQVKVDFVAIRAVDLDNLQVKFDRLPFPLAAAKPSSEGTFLQSLTGSLVSQIYQTIVRTRGDVVHTPLITTADSVPATFQVNTHISLFTPLTDSSGGLNNNTFQNQRAKSLLLQAGLTVTPRLNIDGSITLNLVPQVGDVNATTTGPRAAILRTVPNGGMMVLVGLPLSREKPTDDQELLIFVTPTILGTETRKADMGQPDLPPASFQDTSPASKKTLFLEVSHGDLRTVVAMLERQANVKASVLGTGQMYKPVYVHLDGVSLSKALRTVAWSAGARVIRDENGVYVFSPLSAPSPLPASFPVTPSLDYRWHTLVLQHAKPGDILTSMHWNEPATTPNPTALPTGVLRIYALQSTNALLVEATEEGFATVTKLVRTLDSAPRSVEFHMSLVAVPEARARLYTPDMPASQLLPLLLAGESRVASVPTATITDGQTTLFSIDSPVSPPPVSRFRLAQAGPMPEGRGLSTRCEFRLTPRINADGTITLSLTLTPASPPSSAQITVPRTLRSGELVVYDVTGGLEPHGERLFFFVRPTLSGDHSDADGGPSVTVTP